MNINTTYFDAMQKVAKDYETRKEEHNKNRPMYGTPEYEEWEIIRDINFSKYPISGGVQKAYWACMTAINEEADEVVVKDFCWENEIEDFVNALRKAGVTQFVTTDTSTALMENIHGLVANGCEMGELVEIENTSRLSDKPTISGKPIKGIRFYVK